MLQRRVLNQYYFDDISVTIPLQLRVKQVQLLIFKR